MKKHQDNRFGTMAPRAMRVTYGRTLVDKLTKSKRRRSVDHICVKCGDCESTIRICPDIDDIEIGGVMGHVAEWRAILLPLLGIPGYERYPDIDKALADYKTSKADRRAKAKRDKASKDSR
jgi:hypothetical protein